MIKRRAAERSAWWILPLALNLGALVGWLSVRLGLWKFGVLQ